MSCRIIFSSAVLLIFILLYSPGSSAETYEIEGHGDHSLWVLINDLKDNFRKDTGISPYLVPEFAIAGKGCAKGIIHAVKGSPDRNFGIVCCELNKKIVKNSGLRVYPVAREPLNIIVNKNNPIKGLTSRQVKEIFSGRIKNWKDVGGPNMKITVITRLHCQEHIPNWTRILGKPEEFIKGKLNVSSEPDMARTVADFRTAIGHLEMTSVLESKLPLKVLPIDGYMPTTENMEKGLYPFWAILSVVTKGEAGGKVVNLIEYLRKHHNAKKAMERYGMYQMKDY